MITNLTTIELSVNLWNSSELRRSYYISIVWGVIPYIMLVYRESIVKIDRKGIFNVICEI